MVEQMLMRREISSLADFFFFFMPKTLNKQTDLQRTTHCFTLFVCGGPCHLSYLSNSVLGPYFPLRATWLLTYRNSLYYYLINIINI